MLLTISIVEAPRFSVSSTASPNAVLRERCSSAANSRQHMSDIAHVNRVPFVVSPKVVHSAIVCGLAFNSTWCSSAQFRRAGGQNQICALIALTTSTGSYASPASPPYPNRPIPGATCHVRIGYCRASTVISCVLTKFNARSFSCARAKSCCSIPPAESETLDLLIE